jgi:hypothetical protein
VYTDKAPIELLSFYIGNLTGIQADRLMQPFKGMWIKATGRVQYLSANEFGRITVLITLPAHNMHISCEFDSKEWETRLERLSNNDILSVSGQIDSSQTRQQLHLKYCELTSD